MGWRNENELPMVAILYAVITVLAWGTWLAPSQEVRFASQEIKTFYVAFANLALALVVTFSMGLVRASLMVFWFPFLGGLVWAVSSLCAFTATRHIGIAKAFGIWAPLNIVVSLLWGALLLSEFPDAGLKYRILLIVSVLILLAGVLLILLSKGEREIATNGKSFLVGVAGAAGAGVLWGSYFIPLKYASVSMWVGALPLAIGIFTGSSVLALLSRKTFRLEKRMDFYRAGLTGVLWGIGNYGMLLLVEQLGAGRGFTIAQLSVVVNALVGIYWLREPEPKTRAAGLTLVGCLLATLGGVLLGSLE